MKKLIFASAALAVLGGCGSSTEVADQTASEQPVVAEAQGAAEDTTEAPVVEMASAATVTPPPAVAQCRSCHTFDKGGRNGVGPNLWGVFGKSAAQHEGFNYSAAFKSASLTWDRETLDAYLKSPMKAVPGTRMAFPGIANDAKRGEVIDFLQTLAD